MALEADVLERHRFNLNSQTSHCKVGSPFRCIFFCIEYAYGCSVHLLLFRSGIDNWNWYIGIGNFEM